jgi:hypothetical protein
MQGLSISTDQQGQPQTFIIDVNQHDDRLNPLVAGLFQLIQQQDEEQERREFFDASGITANAAYDEDEYEYTVADLKTINPDFNPYATH